ncbi:DUF1559 domain-containing protein [uncultured Gimesia sp.]|uniref:DUF1559 family PulG-like putative transporter n=1 Tax=uncultured Gimesia sp. TaxID=1678688 RepID=UPI0030D8BB87|tara:strand:+ start:14324 stop:15247 length:924 start_codon:yes stop_codon:yes gene_type:complete
MLNQALYNTKMKPNRPLWLPVLLLASAFSFMSLASSRQKNQQAGPQTPQAATEKKPNESSPSETANSKTPSVPQNETIVPAMTIKPGKPMMAERFKVVKVKLKQLGLAFHNLHEENRHFLPTPEQHPENYNKNGRFKVSWRVHLLHLLNQMPLHEKFKLDEAWSSPHNPLLAKNMPDGFRSPDTPAYLNLPRFRVFEGKWEQKGDKSTSTMFPLGTPTRIRDTTDGTSNTILVVAVGPDKTVEWTKPGGLNFDHSKEEFGASAAGIPVLPGDGSSRRVKRNINESNWKEIIGPQDSTRIDWDSIELQ